MTDGAGDVNSSRTVQLGNRTINRMGFGAMRLTDAAIWGPPDDRAGSVRLARRAVDLGVGFIDTADSYGLGVSEEILREALHPFPEHLVIATKIGQVQTRPGQWVPVGRPEYLRQQTELSLRRLGVDRLDLVHLHRVDPKVPFEDQVGELKALQDEGKIALVGLSEVDVAQIEAARAIVDIASVENMYNMAARGWDDVVTYTEREGIVFAAWFPIMSGALVAPGGVVAGIAEELSVTAAQVSLAWLLARSSTIVPIPGTTSLAHLEENVRAGNIELSPEQFSRLSTAGFDSEHVAAVWTALSGVTATTEPSA